MPLYRVDHCVTVIPTIAIHELEFLNDDNILIVLNLFIVLDVIVHGLNILNVINVLNILMYVTF